MSIPLLQIQNQGGMPEVWPATGQVRERKPPWLKVRAPGGPTYLHVQGLMRGQGLHTICEEAHCPNIGECWEQGTATFLIMGDICTRGCRFCAVTKGKPAPPDPEEPARLAAAVARLNLRHAVITSVNRDDLPDKGAGAFAAVIREARARCPHTSIEVLIPDLRGALEGLDEILEAGPDVLNHNLETVRRLYPRVRPGADYDHSLALLRRARARGRRGLVTKAGFMVGVGETRPELQDLMVDLRGVECEVLTVGQYLRPSAWHLPIVRYYAPEEFAEIKRAGLALGFRHVESGPLVRSSYHAADQVPVVPASNASADPAR
jgi:lipoic acid synthetase